MWTGGTFGLDAHIWEGGKLEIIGTMTGLPLSHLLVVWARHRHI